MGGVHEKQRDKVYGGNPHIKISHKVVAPEEGAVPVWVEGHDQVKGHKAEGEGVGESNDGRENFLNAPAMLPRLLSWCR